MPTSKKTAEADVNLTKPKASKDFDAKFLEAQRALLIEERARIENSVLWSSTRVGQSAVVRRSFIGKGGIIGRNTIIEGAILGDKSSLTDYSII